MNFINSTLFDDQFIIDLSKMRAAWTDSVKGTVIKFDDFFVVVTRTVNIKKYIFNLLLICKLALLSEVVLMT